MEISTELLKMYNLDVTQAWNGKEAVELFREMGEGFFDIILMDMQMPVMNGCEAARQIRAMKRPDASTIPIIAVTANAFSEDIAATRNAGMNAHISKPIDFEIFRKTVESLLKDRKTAEQKKRRTAMKQIRKYEAALIQMDTQNDKGENLKKARRFIEEAAAHGAKLICFPEVMNLIGKNTGEGGGREEVPGYTSEILCEEAKKHGVYIHAGSITEQVPGQKRSRNLSFLINPEERLSPVTASSICLTSPFRTELRSGSRIGCRGERRLSRQRQSWECSECLSAMT